MKKAKYIFLNLLPILVMIGLIPLISNDYVLAWVYTALIIIFFAVKRTKNDGIIFFFGFFSMIIFESIFISTGVEMFARNSLFGLMPIWLPFIWGYSFVAMKRSVLVLNSR